MEQMRTLDPEGVSARLRHRLTRRVYVNKGPNYLIHIDGYDKLKRYGFPIHGAIDGQVIKSKSSSVVSSLLKAS